MRDYFWKQRNPDSSEAAASDLPMDPSQYKGRFRLNSPPNSTKGKAGAKKDKTRAKKSNQVVKVQKARISRDRGPLLDIRFYLTDGLLEKIPPTMLGATLDPFDSFHLDMKPEALKLLWYCKSSQNQPFCATIFFFLFRSPLSLRHLVSSWRYHVYCILHIFPALSCLELSCLISSDIDHLDHPR